MSKILRRPMFRGGGKVSSYGNGIATGLADGGMPGKRGLVDGPGGYAGEYKFGETPAARGLGYLNNEFNKMLAAGYDLGAVPLNTLGRAFGYNPGFSGTKFMDSMTQGNFTKNNPKLNPDKASFFLETDAKKGFTLPSMQPEKQVEEKIEDENKKSAAELALIEKNNALTSQLEKLLAPKEKDTKEESIAAIKQKQELMEEVLGGGKSARIADASDMALSFASKALGEGATVKSAFADFLGDESKRPSRSQKVKDAAANAAIQSYLTEQMSEKDFNKQMQLIMGKQTLVNNANDPANMDWNKRRSYYQTIGKDRNRDVDSVIKSALQDEPESNNIIFTEETDFITDPTIAATKEDGFYVVTTKNGKRIFSILGGIVTDRSSEFPI
jgi:hypothetical protein|tara:strand:+ start:378 stop:1532 length:1155 start_codon:yes stop_codon:yes gene_type:complete